jgi:PAS domain S-box-containing protein
MALMWLPAARAGSIPVQPGGMVSPHAPVIRIGIDRQYAFGSFVDPQGRKENFTTELVRAMAANGRTDYQVVVSSWTDLVTEFKAGRLDVLANAIYLPELRATMDLSVAHASLHAVGYTRLGAPVFHRTTEFKGRKIAVLIGSSTQVLALKHEGWGATLVPCNTRAECMRAVHDGACDVFLFLRPSPGRSREEPGLRATFIDDITADFHMAVHKGDSGTLERVNADLVSVMRNGTFDKLYDEWIGPIEPRPIMLSDLQPYYWPAAFVVVLLLGLFLWQQSVLAVRKQSEEKFRLAFETGADAAFWSTQEEGRMIEINRRFETMFGYTRAEVIGRTSMELGLFAAHEDRQRMLADLTVHGPTLGIELDLRRKNGEPVAVAVSLGLTEIRGQRFLLGSLRDITERKQLERKQVELAAIVESSFDAIIGKSLAGVITSWNPGAEKIFGYSAAEAIGQPLLLVFPPERRQEEADILARIARGETVAHYGTERVRKDGRRISISATISPLRDGQGRVVGASKIARDITESRRAELDLRRAEALYRGIFEGAPVGIYRVSPEGRPLAANPAIARVLGFGSANEVLTAITDAGHQIWRDPAQRADYVRRLETDGVVQDFECEVRRQNGELVWISINARRVADPEGRTLYFEGFVEDITERKRARDMLEKFNAELEERVALRTNELTGRNREIEALLDSIPDTVLLCDGSGAVISSHSPADQPGLIRAGGGPPANGHDPVWREIARAMHALARAPHETVVREFDRTLHGALLSIEARATPVGPDRRLILLRDISARKRIERDMLANLERERQLSAMKSQFITVASHEFRTPLASATGSLELLERHAGRITETKRRELLARAQRSLARLITIMDHVHQLSRADSGRVLVNRMAVDLGQIVRDLIREVEAGDRRQHPFAFQATGRSDAVPVDTNLFNHILSNLLGNAVRYSPAGAKISVTLEIGAPSFALTVADEGIGIPAAERERVFEPFARGSNVGQISGTGLGLNIVKRYTELMGGRIELLPTARGAAFRVVIPLG